MKTVSIAIDVGTGNSEACYINKAGMAEVIPNLDGDLKTPSVVSLAGGKALAGKAATPDFFLNPRYVACRYKTCIGKNTESGKPIPLLTDPNGREWSPVDLTAANIRYIKESAESYLGEPVTAAVITIPAYFGEAERLNTKAAAKIAGLTHVRLEDEPVAAATYYGLEKRRNENIVTIDWGTGTLDITAMECRDSNVKALRTEGDAELGGGNWDDGTLGWLREKAKAEGIDISAETDLATHYQHLDRCREAKEMLSRREEVTVIAEAGGHRTAVKLNRHALREIGRPLDERFIRGCERMRDWCKAQGKAIDRVLLVGGCSRLYHVPEMARKVFGIEPSRDADPDFAVVKGAAIMAAVHFGDKGQIIAAGGYRYLAEDIHIQKVAAHAICVAACRNGEDDGKEYNVAIVPAGVPLPHDFEERFARD